MKENNRIRSTGMLITLSILMMLSGMVAMVSADGTASLPNQFYGTVMIDGADAPVGTNISAYIDGVFKGSVVVKTPGKYGEMPDLDYLEVNGNDGEIISFTIGVENIDQIVTWNADELPRELNLWIGESPAADEGASHTDADDTPPTDAQDISPDGATGSAMVESGRDETPKPGPLPDATISASEENVTSAPSSIPTTKTTAAPSTSIKKPGEESKEGFLPGFEAVFAIAGFLAVVCLVRRRR